MVNWQTCQVQSLVMHYININVGCKRLSCVLCYGYWANKYCLDKKPNVLYYDLLKFWGFYEFRVIFEPIIPYMGIQKLKIVKSVPTFHGHNFGSFWARDSSKKAFFSSWLALSNGLPRARMALSREIPTLARYPPHSREIPTPKSSIPGEARAGLWLGH